MRFFSQRNLSIQSTQQFIQKEALFLRLEWRLDDGWDSEKAFGNSFSALAESLDAEFQVTFFNRKQTMGLFVGSCDYCLKAVLNIWQLGYLGLLDIRFIVGSDGTARHLADSHAVPFFEVDGDALQREKKQLEIVRRYSPEFLGLPENMPPPSAVFLDQINAVAFNVSRSFLLPDYRGVELSSLYQQGVKLLGASARIASADIDRGAIIEQDAQRIDDTANFAQFIESVHQIEQRVFCQALVKLLQHKVLFHKNACMVFA